MKKFDAIGVGLHAVDMLYFVPEKIKTGEKYVMDSFALQGGGPAGSGLSAITRLGYKGAFVARAGDNASSALSLAEMKRNQIDSSFVVRDKESSPAFSIVQIGKRTSERTIFVGMADYGYLKQKDIPVAAIKNARVMLVDSYDLRAAEMALKAAYGTRCRTVIDFEGGDPDKMRKLLKYGTDIILPLATAKALSGQKTPAKALKKLSEFTQGQLVTTDGKNGSWALTKNGVIHMGIVNTGKRVDSTGCGDAYHAGYAIGVLEDWELPMRMEMGAFLAGLVLTGLGGRTALPFKDELKSLAKKHARKISPRLARGLFKIANRK